jgi:hypothetical protein
LHASTIGSTIDPKEWILKLVIEAAGAFAQQVAV